MTGGDKPNSLTSGGDEGSFREFLYSWRYFLWLLGIILLVALVLGEENWRGDWAWNRYKSQMAAKGEPIELTAVVPPKVPDDQNFAMTPFLAPLFDFAPAPRNLPGSKPVASLNSFANRYEAASRELNNPKSTPFSSWLKPPTDLPAWYVAFEVSSEKAEKKKNLTIESSQRGYRFSTPQNGNAETQPGLSATNYTPAEAAKGVLGMLSDTEGIFEQLQAASELPYCRFNLNYEQDDPAGILLPHLSVMKRLCLILQLRACGELTLAQTDRAFQDVQLMFYLADAFHDEPFAVSQSVRMSCLSITLQAFAEGIHQWPEQNLRDFQQRLGRFDFCLDASRVLKAERVWSSTIINYVENAPNKVHLLDSMFGSDEQQGFALGTVLMSVSPDGWFALEKLNCCRMIDRYVLPAIDVGARRINPQPTHAAKQALSSLAAGSAPGLFSRHLFFSRMLLPARSGLARRAAMAQTGVDCAILACALELYRRENRRLPESLSALEPRFIARVPRDIITGQPLKYHPAADGRYSLYSVGWNEIDDGGLATVAKPGERETPPREDWVWRLP